MAVTRRFVAPLVVVIYAVAMLAAGLAPARAAPVFSVADVTVDVTAKDAAAARKQARIDGQRDAFRRLLRRIVLAADYARLPTPSDREITNLVRSFEVANERVAPNRYLASLTFHFKPEEIGRYLRTQSIPYAVTLSRPVIVLPLFRTRNGLLLWEDGNPWRDAWLALPPGDGLVPVIVPIGGLADLALVSAEQAEAGDRDRLARLADRYGATEVVVAKAEVERESLLDARTVVVSLRRYQIESMRIGGGTYSGMAWEPLDTVLDVAAGTTRTQLEEEWKGANLLRFDRAQSVAVDIPLRGLDDWLDIRRRMSDLALVRRVELTALSSRFARVILHYLGDPRQLSAALAHSDLLLSQEADLWLLRRRGARSRNSVASQVSANANSTSE